MITFRSYFSVILICVTALFNVSCESKDEIKLKQYKVIGMQIYMENCANCHQINGTGLGKIYPPLYKSDYLANKDQVMYLIRYGIDGPIIVNGQLYNRHMPGNSNLMDFDIAALTTYIYTKWGGEQTITDVSHVSNFFSNSSP